MTTGTFLGWRRGDDFFASDGSRAGRFSGEKLFRDSDGVQVGFLFEDGKRVGWRNGYEPNTLPSRGTTTDKVNETVPADIGPNDNAAWTDPRI
jgi:hypothetical protein